MTEKPDMLAITSEGRTHGNPYVGPRTFREEEAEFFFGREQESRDLLSLVLAERLVLFYAQSGAGKSSLINTKLRPELVQEGYTLFPAARLNGNLPGGIPEVSNIFIFNLIVGLDQNRHALVDLVDLTLSEYLTLRRSELTGDDAASDAPQLLVIDQFEEIFTTNQEHWERRADFFDQLRVAMQAAPWLWVLLVLREDYLAAIQPYSRQLPGHLRTRYYMQRLDREAALAAVTCPAAKESRPFATGVAEALVDDLLRIQVGGGAEGSHLGEFVEPVQLQVVCYRLWANLCDRPAGEITQADVVAAGDVDQALTDFYNAAIARTIKETGVDERNLRNWLNNNLTTSAHTRGLVYRGAAETAGMPNAIADSLRDAYILRAEVRGSDTWYELSHDRLVEPIWAANLAWLTEHRSALALAAEFWWNSGQDARRLLKGVQLKEAETRLRHTPVEFDERERAFINASSEARRRQTNRRLAWILGTGLSLVLVLVGLSAWALVNRGQAQKERIGAEQARAAAEASEQAAVKEQEAAENLARQVRVRQLAAEAQVAAEKAPQRNLLLAVEAFDESASSGQPRDPVAEQALRAALSQTGGVGLGGHLGGISRVLISPDSRWLVTQSWAEDDNPRLWDLLSTDVMTSVVVLKGHTGAVTDVVISSDSRRVATSGVDGKVHLWDLKKGNSVAAPIVLAGDSGPFGLLAFSPDGQWLAAAGDQYYPNPSGGTNTAIHLWHLDSTVPPDDPVVLAGHTTAVTAMKFSPDGTWLASAGGYDDAGSGEPDKTVRLWDLSGVRSGTSGRVLEGNKAVVSTLAFSTDGRWLAAGGMEGTAYLWDVARGSPADPYVLTGHSGAVSSLIFSSDSHWLLTVAGYGRSGEQPDTTPRLWNLTVPDPSTEAISLSGHRKLVRDAAFRPGGKTLATASLDTTVRLWDIRGATPITNVTTLIGHDSGIGKLAFSPDGRWLASAEVGDELGVGSAGTTVRVWDVESNDPAANPMTLTGHSAPVSALAFSQNGNWLVTGSYDGSARIWDFRYETPQPDEPHTLAGNRGQIDTVAASPDGRWVAAADGYDSKTQHWYNAVHLWQVAEPVSAMVPVTLTGHMQSVSSLAFSSDGHWFATGDSAGQVRIWDLAAGDLAAPYKTIWSGSSAIQTMSFSADNRWLITGSTDGAARLWTLQGSSAGQIAQMLSQEDAEVTTGVVSPDGYWYASGDNQGTIRLWYLGTAGAATAPVHLRGHVGPIAELAFSPDNRWLASAGSYDDTTGASDTIVRLWRVDTDVPGLEPVLLKGHTGQIKSLAFSPDGHWLVTGGGYNEETPIFDNNVRLWDMRSAAPDQSPITLTGHQGEIYSVAFSTDSRRLATGSGDSTVRLWDPSSQDPSSSAVVLTGSKGPINYLAFVGNDTWLVSAGGEGAVRTWDMRPDALLETACRTAGRNLTHDEWEQYFRGQEYRVTCPELPVHASVVQPILEKGGILAKAGDLGGAAKELQRAVQLLPALEIDPPQEARRLAAQAQLEQGRRAMMDGDPTKVRADFKAAHELDASVLADVEAEISELVAQSLLRRGRELAADGDVENAAARFHQALVMDPGLTLDPEGQARELAADGYLDQGYKAANAGRYADAIASFTRAIALRPDSSEAAYVGRGDARRRLGSYHEAVADLTQAIELGDKSVGVLNLRGIAYSWLAQYPEAISDFTAAINLAPDDSVLRFNRAYTLLEQGKIDEAIGGYSKALEPLG